MRNYLKIITLFVVVLSHQAPAQITGTISRGAIVKTILASYRGDKLLPVDTAYTDGNGNVSFGIRKPVTSGLHRLIWGKGNGIDLVYDQKPVSFTTTPNADSTSFGDTLNIDYRELTISEGLFEQKNQLLESLIDGYPPDDPFYQKVTAQYVKEQIDFSAFLNGLVRRHHSDLLGKIALAAKRPFLAPELNARQRKVYLREHYWDAADATDTVLLNTPFYTHKAIEFLTLYSNADYSKEELQASFIQGIDALMPHISENAQVFSFLVDYLINGFEQFGFEDVLQYLATVYQDESCSDEASRSKLAGKVEVIRRMAVGNTAPPLSGKRPDGSYTSLYELNKPYTLVIFWASWCPHCEETLPKINELYNKQSDHNFDILAFSLDKNETEWTDAIKKNNYNWINISELKGWDSRAADQWGVFSTPSIFLIGPGHKIVAKPYNFSELNSKLNELGLIGN